jgi:hypothetical protein
LRKWFNDSSTRRFSQSIDEAPAGTWLPPQARQGTPGRYPSWNGSDLHGEIRMNLDMQLSAAAAYAALAFVSAIVLGVI